MARRRFDDDDEEDERPRRSRRRDEEDDDYDERPRRRRNKPKAGFPKWAWVAIPLGIFVVCGGGLALMMTSVPKVRSAAARAQQTNNMKQIGLGLHLQHDKNKFFAAPFALDDKGQPNPGLSWRVGVLPYIDQDKIYSRFDRSKSWDHPFNGLASNQKNPYVHVAR